MSVPDFIHEGARVRLKNIVGAFPLGFFERGLIGTVEGINRSCSEVIAYVRLDELSGPDPRLKDWDNCLEVGTTPELWLTSWEDWELYQGDSDANRS